MSRVTLEYFGYTKGIASIGFHTCLKILQPSPYVLPATTVLCCYRYGAAAILGIVQKMCSCTYEPLLVSDIIYNRHYCAATGMGWPAAILGIVQKICSCTYELLLVSVSVWQYQSTKKSGKTQDWFCVCKSSHVAVHVSWFVNDKDELLNIINNDVCIILHFFNADCNGKCLPRAEHQLLIIFFS